MIEYLKAIYEIVKANNQFLLDFDKRLRKIEEETPTVEVECSTDKKIK